MSSLEVAREATTRQIGLLRALSWAIEHVDEVRAIVRRSDSGSDSVTAFEALGFDTSQAHLILDLPVRRLSRENVAALQTAISELENMTDGQLADETAWPRVDWKP